MIFVPLFFGNRKFLSAYLIREYHLIIHCLVSAGKSKNFYYDGSRAEKNLHCRRTMLRPTINHAVYTPCLIAPLYSPHTRAACFPNQCFNRYLGARLNIPRASRIWTASVFLSFSGANNNTKKFPPKPQLQ